jgi:hypothetical protein
VADFDVGVLGLSVPPPVAVIQAYRPAVSVRNNGIHDALATGYIRIYSAGLLVFESEVFSATIPPGETKTAQAFNYWTPAAIGTYMVAGYVTCDRDQVEPNNNLAPTTIRVGNEPPPPPPVVTLHASQHEEGGLDEVNIDGLSGRAAEAQTPTNHASDHELGGDDEVSLTGLHGLTADQQNPTTHGSSAHDTTVEKTAHRGAVHGYAPLDGAALVPVANLPPTSAGPHKTTHENGGTDEISIAGLSGKAADAQDPTSHGSSTHDSTVEATAHKGAASGYAGLDQFTHVPKAQLGTDQSIPPIPSDKVLFEDSTWRAPLNTPVAHKATHENGGTDEISLAGLSGKAADAQDPTTHKTNHENGGTDEISVAGLSGQLADSQPPLTHGSASHLNDAPIAIVPAWTSDAGSSVSASKADHRHAAGGRQYVRAGTSTYTDLTYHICHSGLFPADVVQTGSTIRVFASGTISTDPNPGACSFQLWIGNAVFDATLNLLGFATDAPWSFEALVTVTDGTPGHARFHIFVRLMLDPSLYDPTVIQYSPDTDFTLTREAQTNVALLFRWITRTNDTAKTTMGLAEVAAITQ